MRRPAKCGDHIHKAAGHGWMRRNGDRTHCRTFTYSERGQTYDGILMLYTIFLPSE